MAWKKGQSGNPRGRAPILDKGLLEQIKADKNAAKKLILLYLKMTPAQTRERLQKGDVSNIEHMISQILERAINDGDPVRGRMLMEMVFGTMVEDPSQIKLSQAEEALVLEYRRRLLERGTPVDV